MQYKSETVKVIISTEVALNNIIHYFILKISSNGLNVQFARKFMGLRLANDINKNVFAFIRNKI